MKLLLVVLLILFAVSEEAEAFGVCLTATKSRDVISSTRYPSRLSLHGLNGEAPKVSQDLAAAASPSVPPPASRRLFVVSTFSFGLIAGGCVGASMTANAKYGEGTSMELPSYIDYLIEKNAVPDDSTALYKGADPATILRRLQESEKRLQEIPALTEEKKWTQISGLVTGPLGTLSQTISQIATPDSKQKVKDMAKKVKADVLGIGQAAERKNGDGCVAQAAAASKDLKSLLEAAFE
ncbi:MAG: hypothetical protein SGILL_010884 [Bacillariaceae sp.]